jgi:Ferritin-like
MVQYLFAAYSLGGPQVPEPHRPVVRAWQGTILGVAKEEMGHPVTVQNLHTALGLAPNLDRRDYPWGSEFYPFEFTLERLSPSTLATYVCAESPEGWEGPRRTRSASSRRAPRARRSTGRRPSTTRSRRSSVTASASVTPRLMPRPCHGMRPGTSAVAGTVPERGQSSNLPDVPAPDLLILEVSSRDTALEALAEIGEQGGSPTPIDGTDPSDAGEDSPSSASSRSSARCGRSIRRRGIW